MNLDLFRKLYPTADQTGVDASELPPFAEPPDPDEFAEPFPEHDYTVEVRLKLSSASGYVVLPPLVLDERVGIRELVAIMPDDEQIWLEIESLHAVEVRRKGTR